MDKAAEAHQLRYADSGRPATLQGLSRGLAEWTTTKYDFRAAATGRAREGAAKLQTMHILKGYGDPEKLRGLVRMPDALLAPPDSESPMIGFRCVRSGAPRFFTREAK
jgi:hypothetical protein